MENSVPTPSLDSLTLHRTMEIGVVCFPLVSIDFPLWVSGIVSCSTEGVPSEFSSVVFVSNFHHLEVEAFDDGVLFLVTLGVDVEVEASWTIL